MKLRLGAGLAVLAAIGVGWLWHSPSDQRPTGEVESEIRAWADRHTAARAPIRVTCPDPVEWRVGGTFHCLVRQHQETVRVTVTMENDAGAVTWVVG